MDTTPVARLILDEALYPRHRMNDGNTSRLSEALRAGENLPPVIACRQTRKVVDGFHRCAAALRVYGDEAVVDVEWRDYPKGKRGNQQRFGDAMALNSKHGHPLTHVDFTRCRLIGEQMDISSEEIAKRLRIRRERLETRTRAVAFEPTGRGDARRPIPLKRSLSHLTGRTLTGEQVAANDHAGGFSHRFMVNQLIEAIRSESLDLTNEELVAALGELAALVATLGEQREQAA